MLLMTDKNNKLNKDKDYEIPPSSVRPNEKIPSLYIQEERTLFNTSATNALAGEKKFMWYDDVTKKAKYEIKNGTCDIESSLHSKFAKNFPIKFFDALACELTRINNRGVETVRKSFDIRVKDFQKYFGYKNYASTKKLLKKWIDILYSYSISHTDILHCGRKKLFLKKDTRILGSKSEIKNGLCNIEFTEHFAKYLVWGYLIEFSQEYFKLPDTSAEIYRKLCLYARINKNKKNNANQKDKYILSIKSILENVQSIPSYSEVIKSNDRHTGIRIIKPFEDALNELENRELVEFEYCNQKGKVMTDEQLITKGTELKWGVFENLYIKYSLTKHKNEPEMLLESKKA